MTAEQRSAAEKDGGVVEPTPESQGPASFSQTSFEDYTKDPLSVAVSAMTINDYGKAMDHDGPPDSHHHSSSSRRGGPSSRRSPAATSNIRRRMPRDPASGHRACYDFNYLGNCPHGDKCMYAHVYVEIKPGNNMDDTSSFVMNNEEKRATELVENEPATGAGNKREVRLTEGC